MSGSLVVVGTGIQWSGQTTLAAQNAIKSAQRVLFAVADPWSAHWVRELNPAAESLPYGSGDVPRRGIYAEMVERILVPLREELRVCAVFYGHPGVLTNAAHEVIHRARAEGHATLMLPGVSFLDCLFADLGVDPGREGCQIHEATDFLLRCRPFDAHSPLVLCQPALIGNRSFYDGKNVERIRRGLELLAEVLGRHYPAHHPVTLYEAATLPVEQPRMERVELSRLAQADLTEVSTLYVPPVGPAPVDARMLARLGMNVSLVKPEQLEDT